MWFFFALPLAVASPNPPAAPANAATLPQAIRLTLNEEYPGWKLAPVTQQVQKEFKKHLTNRIPSLGTGDFDGDGKKDYAVQIALTTPGEEEQIIIAFLARLDGYEEVILQSMGLDPTAYIWVANKPMTEMGNDAQDKIVHRDVLMVLGGPLVEATYSYEDGKFHQLESTEISDKDDTNIPRTSSAAP